MVDIISPKRCELISNCFFKIEEIVVLCATKAIDVAMKEVNPEWFAEFKKADEIEEKPIIIEKGDRVVSSVDYLDFQATMKILAYRKEYFAPVFQKYELPTSEDSKFSTLLLRLIKTRNEISGHFDAQSILSKYSQMDTEAARRLVLRFREGILDFITFLNYFPNMCDNYGKSYLSIAEAENSKAEKLLNVFSYNIEETIKNEGLEVSVAEFEQLCKRVGIRYSSDDDGNSYFETENYDKTIKSIKALIEEMSKKTVHLDGPLPNTDNKKNLALIIAIIVIVLLLLALLGKAFLGGDDKGSESSSPSSMLSSIFASNNGVPSSPDSNSFNSSSVAPNGSSQEEKEPEITGKGRLGGLTVKVDCVPSQYLSFEYENKDSNGYSFGWVTEQSQVIVETSDKKYYGKVAGFGSSKIAADSEGTFNASFDEEFEGTIKKITITNLKPLSDVGLPDGESLTLRIPIEYK